MQATHQNGSPDHSVNERVSKVINLLRPVVQADGGDIEFVGVGPDGVVQVRMHGSCLGCPSAEITLAAGIERNLKDHVPEVKGVKTVP